jgi:hypothetical protein
LLAFGGVALSLMRGPLLIITVLSVLAAIGLLMSAVPRLRGMPGRHAVDRRRGPVAASAAATDPARDPVGTSGP